MSYIQLSNILKVIANPSRLEILDLLSCGELCACDLLIHFNFSQPTLSHHMKLLVDCKLVFANKVGNKQIYKLNHRLFEQVTNQLNLLHSTHNQCICHTIKKGEIS
ncbi:metalloregulator ArsR/SmtB family transcription factor [Staphylococcus epidermidis]|nr:metalloregulator ArsR/SmtB family transcription factor [Staphylococcus epidermidis]MCG1884700.1 metalloregulator ArsR/SmtB family transcription factor [Staphylococcus epidermidis]MCG2074727.1 metalloregulator ArsR/SmtB family transcription factor [Staphylococcus epidermidis]